MTIEKHSHPYEYLVRFNPDGTVRGQHIKYLEVVADTETNEVFAEKEGDALSVGDEQSAVMLEAALGKVNAALAKAEETERTAKLAAETKRQEAETAAEQLAQVLTEKQTKIQQLESERETIKAERDQLKAEKLARGKS